MRVRLTLMKKIQIQNRYMYLFLISNPYFFSREDDLDVELQLSSHQPKSKNPKMTSQLQMTVSGWMQVIFSTTSIQTPEPLNWHLKRRLDVNDLPLLPFVRRKKVMYLEMWKHS